MRKGKAVERHRGIFWRRMVTHSGITLAIVGSSLGFGMWGYEHYEHLPWRDVFLNADSTS